MFQGKKVIIFNRELKSSDDGNDNENVPWKYNFISFVFAIISTQEPNW